MSLRRLRLSSNLAQFQFSLPASGVGRFANKILRLTIANVFHCTGGEVELDSKSTILSSRSSITTSSSPPPSSPVHRESDIRTGAGDRWSTANGFGKLTSFPSMRWCPIRRVDRFCHVAISEPHRYTKQLALTMSSSIVRVPMNLPSRSLGCEESTSSAPWRSSKTTSSWDIFRSDGGSFCKEDVDGCRSNVTGMSMVVNQVEKTTTRYWTCMYWTAAVEERWRDFSRVLSKFNPSTEAVHLKVAVRMAFTNKYCPIFEPNQLN